MMIRLGPCSGKDYVQQWKKKTSDDDHVAGQNRVHMKIMFSSVQKETLSGDDDVGGQNCISRRTMFSSGQEETLNGNDDEVRPCFEENVITSCQKETPNGDDDKEVRTVL